MGLAGNGSEGVAAVRNWWILWESAGGEEFYLGRVVNWASRGGEGGGRGE